MNPMADRPQRLAREIADTLGWPCHDLRPVLRAVGNPCPYQRRNKHWTASGHEIVAEYMARQLADHEYARR